MKARTKAGLWLCGIALGLCLTTAQAKPDDMIKVQQGASLENEVSQEYVDNLWRMSLFQVSLCQRRS